MCVVSALRIFPHLLLMNFDFLKDFLWGTIKSVIYESSIILTTSYILISVNTRGKEKFFLKEPFYTKGGNKQLGPLYKDTVRQSATEPQSDLVLTCHINISAPFFGELFIFCRIHAFLHRQKKKEASSSHRIHKFMSLFGHSVFPLGRVWPFRDSPISAGFSRESHLSSKSSLASATLHQGWRLPGYQRCISWSDKARAPLPTQQHPIIDKSSRKEAFVTVYLDCFSSSPLISSSENWCTLKLKRRAWQVMVSVITAQISSAGAFFPLCVQLLELSAWLPVIQCIR